MQLVKNGPDIPAELFEKLDEERLIFFCGSGISMAAGLPDFGGLVDQVIGNLSAARPSENDLDRQLEILENVHSQPVRSEVIRILSKPFRRAGIKTHRAVLELARLKDGHVRLVTTNFDRCFDKAALRKPEVPLVISAAPTLSVPKPSKWGSVVYLHGHISANDPLTSYLVLTSSDFGTAYLTERWASRFMTELFKHFCVLFVGYSINDPVMRYLLDALAADRKNEGDIQPAYALVGHLAKDEKQVRAAWATKGVRPLFYNSRARHHALHTTLRQWAALSRGGLTARAAILRNLATADPTSLSPEQRGQVVWALRDESGYCARIFATLVPPPSIEWLAVMDADESFALREYKSGPSAEVPLVSHLPDNLRDSRLSKRSGYIAEWMCHHLSCTKLTEWILQSGSQLHSDFKARVRDTLAQISPYPKSMTQVWKILSSQPSLTSPTGQFDYGFPRRLETEGFNTQNRLELVNYCQPYLVLSSPSGISAAFSAAQLGSRVPVSGLTSASLRLPIHGHGQEILDILHTFTNKDQILSSVVYDLSFSLERTFDLYSLIEQADENLDLSYIWRPAIEPDARNTDFQDWTTLVDFVREGSAALFRVDANRGRALVQHWCSLRYPIFKRLALAAATGNSAFSAEEQFRMLI